MKHNILTIFDACKKCNINLSVNKYIVHLLSVQSVPPPKISEPIPPSRFCRHVDPPWAPSSWLEDVVSAGVPTVLDKPLIGPEGATDWTQVGWRSPTPDLSNHWLHPRHPSEVLVLQKSWQSTKSPNRITYLSTNLSCWWGAIHGKMLISMCAGGSDARVGFDWMTRWGTLIGWRDARPLLAWPWAASYEVNFLVNLLANKTQFFAEFNWNWDLPILEYLPVYCCFFLHLKC